MSDAIHEVKEATWDDDVLIVGHGPAGWAVMSKCGMFRFHDAHPCVIHGGLSTREAAEIARRDAIDALTAGPHSPYRPFETPPRYFEKVGRVLAKLRAAELKADDLIGLAVDIVEAAAGRSPAPDDADLPF